MALRSDEGAASGQTPFGTRLGPILRSVQCVRRPNRARQSPRPFRAVAAKANALETEELISSASQLVNSADALIGTEEALALPAALTGALDEMRSTLATLRQGGLVDNANATMASARGAADAVAVATERLPALSARLERLVAQSETLLSAYGARSSFNAETLDALHEIKSAARALTQLARRIERDPNSLLFGR